MPARKLPATQDDALADLVSVLLAMGPEELETFVRQLPKTDRQMVERVLAERIASGWRSHPAAMAGHLDPKYHRRRYIEYLSHKLVESVDGTGRRLIVNLPGRAGKTTLLRWFLTWLLDSRPTSQSMFISYGDQLADESAMAVRDLLRVHHGELRVTLKRDRQQRDRFLTTEGGGLLAAGINATITGYGVTKDGVLVLDDPYKNWAEAHSEAARRRVSQQFRGTLRNRLDDENAGMVVVHHRMHHKDLTADLRSAAEDETGEPWEVVALPALAVAGDPLGRAPGETLDPDFPVEKVLRRHQALGTYLSAALEQQDPSPEEGNEIKRGWFHLVDRGETPQAWDQGLTSWDLKLRDKEAGDYVVGQVWVRTGADYWLLDQLRGQYDHATTANAIALLAVRWPTIRQHVVEKAGSYDDVLPQLRKPQPRYVVSKEMAGRLGMTEDERKAVQALRRRGVPGLIGHPVTAGSKPVRVRTFVGPAAEAGNVHLVLAHWTPHLLDELSQFPGGSHDDQTDAMSQALQRMGVGTASLAPARRSPSPPTVAKPAQVPQVRRAGPVATASLLPSRRRR